MNKLFFYILAFSALTFASCSEEEDLISDTLGDVTSGETTDGSNDPEADEPATEVTEVTFTATLENDGSSSAASAASRTTVTDGKVAWSEGDAISVLNSENNFDTFTLIGIDDDGAGKFRGSFSSADGKGGKIAVYPAGSHSYDGENITVNLPSKYGSEDTEYTPNAGVLMLAQKNDNSNNLYFKHLGALLKIPVVVPAGTVSVSLTAKGICGDFVVDQSGEFPTVSHSSTATDCNVTYHFKAFAEEKEAMFYFPIPTGTYPKLQISLLTDNAAGAKTVKLGASGKKVNRKLSANLGKVANVELHEWVDLGIGVLVAKTNIGASTETEYGDYIAWAVTAPQSPYNWTTYPYGEADNSDKTTFGMTKYTSVDGKLVLEAMDDAATANWGIHWRMPTYEEAVLLSKPNANLTHTKETDYKGAGVVGWSITSNVNTEASIFLPAAGRYELGTTKVNIGTECSYWTSTVNLPACAVAKSLRSSGSSFNTTNYMRSYGQTIRPVRNIITNE